MSSLGWRKETHMSKGKKTCATCKWCAMPTSPYPAALAMCGNGRAILIMQDPEKVSCINHAPKN